MCCKLYKFFVFLVYGQWYCSHSNTLHPNINLLQSYGKKTKTSVLVFLESGYISIFLGMRGVL